MGKLTIDDLVKIREKTRHQIPTCYALTSATYAKKSRMIHCDPGISSPNRVWDIGYGKWKHNY